MREIASAVGRHKSRIGQIVASLNLAGEGRYSPLLIKRTWGISAEQHRDILKKYGRHPFQSYTNHRSGARVRGVEFHFTFWEWWTLWLSSGKWDQRGKGSNQYCMARTGDEGAYAVGNVRITTVADNQSERNKTGKYRVV